MEAINVMDILNEIYESISGVFNLAVLSAFVLIGLVLIISDSPTLLKKKLKKESILAKTLGYIYILGGIAFYSVITLL